MVAFMRADLLALIAAGGAVTACGPEDNEGACNDPTLVDPVRRIGALVITEVFADYQAPAGGSGADEGKEWIEIYNASGEPVELQGLAVIHARLDGSRQKLHVVDDVTIAPGQFFTMGNSAQDLRPPYIDYGYAADL